MDPVPGDAHSVDQIELDLQTCHWPLEVESRLGEHPGQHIQALTNLVPVTLGNIVGGSVLVAAVYWFVYLRKKTPD